MSLARVPRGASIMPKKADSGPQGPID